MWERSLKWKAIIHKYIDVVQFKTTIIHDLNTQNNIHYNCYYQCIMLLWNFHK